MRVVKVFFAALAIMCLSTPAMSAVIGFEGGLDSFFTYSGINVTGPQVSGSGYDNVAAFTASTWVAFNPDAFSPSTFTQSAATNFDLTSFVIAGAWGNQTLKIEGLDNGTVEDTSFLPVTPSAQVFTANWYDIDEIRITIDPSGYTHTVAAGEGQHWALDNIRINENGTQVPEPAAMLLLGLGLAGLAGVKRKFSN